ncbi:MAG TPA: hypothetical protein VIX11_09930 [Candidatus Acidoferrum sp.]
MGITGCRWFEGVGNYMDVRRLAVCGDVEPTISPDSPIALTLKVFYSYPGASTEEQGHRGRGEMLTTSFREYERRIREQFTEMFSGAVFFSTAVAGGGKIGALIWRIMRSALVLRFVPFRTDCQTLLLVQSMGNLRAMKLHLMHAR